MSTPVASVIIAARDYGSFLPAALHSVKNQTLRDWECIIVDDASTDDTFAIAQGAADADERFRLIRLDRNLGVSAARNRGIAEARGRYIQFLDADDAIAPGKLERQARYLDGHPDAVLVCSDYFHFTGEPDFSTAGACRADERLEGMGDAIVRRLLKGNAIRINTALVRTDAVRALGGFHERFRAVEDWHLWLRLAATGKAFRFMGDPAAIAAVRMNPRGLSKDGPGMRRWVLPALQDLWASGSLAPGVASVLLLRYAHTLLELRIMKREPVIVLPDRCAAFLLRIVPLTVLMAPVWLLSRPWRGRR
ncbi:MAG: glycosyltransferase family 2 protein [Flavobacteriales bacterium]